MRYTQLLGWMLLSAVSFSPIAASVRYQLCSELVETALAAADEVCDELGRNLACYGHRMLSAEPQDGIETFQFEEAGDTVNVASLNSLRLSPMNVEDGTWGVAMMNVQANIPDEVPEDVNLLLFGDVEVKNLITEEPILMDVLVDSDGNANIRREPNDISFVMASIPTGTIMTANGRSEDGQWISVRIPETDGEVGWISLELIQTTGDLSTLNVVQPYLNQYGPMQAFYLRTGEDYSTCAEAPNDGLLVQTPEGVAEVRLWINEVKIRLGSTAFIQSQPGEQMTIKTLEGKAVVEALGVEQVALAGTSVQIQLNAQSAPAAPPTAPRIYGENEVQNLPVDDLDRPIEVEVLPPDAPVPTVEATVPPPTSPEATQPPVVGTPTATTEPIATLPEETPTLDGSTDEPGAATPEATAPESSSSGDAGSVTEEPEAPVDPAATDDLSGGSSAPQAPSETESAADSSGGTASEEPPADGSAPDSTAEETPPPEETPPSLVGFIGNLLFGR